MQRRSSLRIVGFVAAAYGLAAGPFVDAAPITRAEAVALARDGKTKAAIAALRELLAAAPNAALVAYDLAVILTWAGRNREATEAFEKAVVSVALDSRFERGVHRAVFWVVWYPLIFWILQALTAAVALPKALLRPRGLAGTWVSPDRGIR